MAILSKDAWLSGTDLEEKTVEVPALGGQVKIRSLPAAYSNQASSEALELKQAPGGDQVATVNTAKLEILQFEHGVIEPEFTHEEVEEIAQKYGRSFRAVVSAIDEISGVDKEAIEAANRKFRDGGRGPGGPDVANGDGPGDPEPAVRHGAGGAPGEVS